MLLRRLGIWVLNHVPPLRRLALRLMTGRLGRVPKLAKVGRSQQALVGHSSPPALRQDR